MDNQEKVNAESVSLLLEISRQSYEEESRRTQIIDTKGGIALPIIVAFALLVVSHMNYKNILAMSTQTFELWLKPFSLFLLYSIALCLSIIATIYMVKVISTREYKKLNPRNIYDEDYLKNDKTPYSFKIIELYIRAKDDNDNQNKKRVKYYKIGWRLTFFAFLAFVLYSILLNVL